MRSDPINDETCTSSSTIPENRPKKNSLKGQDTSLTQRIRIMIVVKQWLRLRSILTQVQLTPVIQTLINVKTRGCIATMTTDKENHTFQDFL